MPGLTIRPSRLTHLVPGLLGSEVCLEVRLGAEIPGSPIQSTVRAERPLWPAPGPGPGPGKGPGPALLQGNKQGADRPIAQKVQL